MRIGVREKAQVRGLPLFAAQPAAAQGIRLVDLCDQSSPGGSAFRGAKIRLRRLLGSGGIAVALCASLGSQSEDIRFWACKLLEEG